MSTIPVVIGASLCSHNCRVGDRDGSEKWHDSILHSSLYTAIINSILEVVFFHVVVSVTLNNFLNTDFIKKNIYKIEIKPRITYKDVSRFLSKNVFLSFFQDMGTWLNDASIAQKTRFILVNPTLHWFPTN